jgi:copper(I)-binding protein
MKIRLYAFALLANLVFAAVACAAPELTVEHGTFNFGTIAQGKMVQHTFVIRNSGDASLQIKQLSASCGCTAAKSSSSQIAPGRSAEIQVNFDSGNFSGPVEKTVTMTTNAGKLPSYTFKFEGNIVEALQVTPRQLSLGPLPAGVAKQATFTVTNRGATSVKLLAVNVSSSSLQIKATIKKSELKPGETGSIELVVTPRPEAKVLSGYLHIQTNYPQKKEITVPVYGSPVK